MGAPVCASRRADDLSWILARDFDGLAVLPALGSLDLRFAPRRCIAFDPISGSSLFSVVAAAFFRPERDDYVAADRCDCRDVISSPGPWLLFRERGLTRQWSEQRTAVRATFEMISTL